MSSNFCETKLDVRNGEALSSFLVYLQNAGTARKQMMLTNSQLQNFIGRIKLPSDGIGVYREQMNNLRDRLAKKIDDDPKTGIRVTKFLIAGSWKKHTILRSSGYHPIDIDLVLFVEGDETWADDLERLHDFIVGYLTEIYPTKDISRDTDAEGRTKSIKIKFVGTGLELDIVPVGPTRFSSGICLAARTRWRRKVYLQRYRPACLFRRASSGEPIDHRNRSGGEMVAE